MSSFAGLLKSNLSGYLSGVGDAAPRQASSQQPLRRLSESQTSQSGDGLLAKVDRLIETRRRRGDYLPAHLFAEPAWDILLTLAQAELRSTPLSTTSLCDALSVPRSTALRWVSHLADAGCIERHPDCFDTDPAFLTLTEDASDRLRAYLEAWS